MNALPIAPLAPVLPPSPPAPPQPEGMPAWRYAFRYGALPLYTNPELRALYDALHSQDARLYAGATTTPICTGPADTTRCCRACLLAYPLWRGRALDSVSSVMDAFGSLLHGMDARLSQHGVWKPIITLWDQLGTPGTLLWQQVMDDVDTEYTRRKL